MSRSDLKTRAEVLKIARLLAAPPERLSYLEKLAPAELRALRDRATDRFYDGDSRFGRIAYAARLPPLGMTAFIAQRAFGPLLCARIAGRLETRHAVGLADRMPSEFLAELAIALDPRRVSAIVAGLPPLLIAEVAAELTRAGEYVTMGRFVGHMTDEAIVEALRVIDDASLLRISYVMEEDAGLVRVIALLSERRLRSTIRVATDADLWPEALDLLGRVPEELAGRLADLAAQEDDRVLDGMVATAQRDGLWDAVLPVTRTMTEASRRRFAGLRSIHAPEVLTAIVRAALRGPAWTDLLPLVPLLPRDAQSRVWEEVVATAADLGPEHHERLAGVLAGLTADQRKALQSPSPEGA